MWCYHRILRIPWTETNTNEWVLKELRVQKTLPADIVVRVRKLSYFGHTTKHQSEAASAGGKRPYHFQQKKEKRKREKIEKKRRKKLRKSRKIITNDHNGVYKWVKTDDTPPFF